MVMHIRDVIAKAGSFDRFRTIVKRATAIEGGGGKSSILEERKVRSGGDGRHYVGTSAAATEGPATILQGSSLFPAPDTINDIQKLMILLKKDMNKLVGKTEDTNVIKKIE
jgi:hypothetical protein